MILTPKLRPDGKAFIIYLRHPLQQGKKMCLSLQTRDEDIAKATAADIVTLFASPDILQEPTGEKLRGFSRRAVEIVFGEERAKQLLAEPSGISIQDAKAISAAIGHGPSFTAQIVNRLSGRTPEEGLKGYRTTAERILAERLRKAEARLQVVEPEMEMLRHENVTLKRQKNEHVKVMLAKAIEEWKPWYEQGRKRHTYNVGSLALDQFCEFMPQGCRLGDIKAGDIDTWLQSLNKSEEEQKAPRTLLKKRNFISIFFGWAMSKYDLIENPVAKCAPIAGVSNSAENIVAIRRLSDLQAFLKSLEFDPYWHAWVSVAVLAGPRFSEQRWLKLSDIYFDEDGDRLRIETRTSGRHGSRKEGTKTGRERWVPLERTSLLKTLREHLGQRRAEQKRSAATAAERSDFLFHTLAPDGSIARTLTPDGLWSDNSTWSRYWGQAAKRAARVQAGLSAEPDADEKREPEFPYYWKYGPAKWRHTFGTLCGNCGMSSLEISKLMGNSEEVAKRHYIASASSGKRSRWPFEF